MRRAAARRRRDVADFGNFANATGKRGALGVVMALGFQEGVREKLEALGLIALDVDDMLRIVELWDPIKQRTAVQSFVYYSKHVEKNSSLSDRIDTFLIETGAEWITNRKAMISPVGNALALSTCPQRRSRKSVSALAALPSLTRQRRCNWRRRGRNDGILTKNLSFGVHVSGVGVGLWSHNLNGFFLLINGLSAGGRPLWTPDALARVPTHMTRTPLARLEREQSEGAVDVAEEDGKPIAASERVRQFTTIREFLTASEFGTS
jgi:hypothetical protein